MAEENGDLPGCDNCACPPPHVLSKENAAAIQVWQALDAFGRSLDTFGGCPMPLRAEAVDSECMRADDPDGVRWRVLLIEEIIYGLRLKKHQARAEQKERERKK